MKEVVIVGGGASGLTAAISAARNGKDVTIIERNNKCGKKILITGNGRCNFGILIKIYLIFTHLIQIY